MTRCPQSIAFATLAFVCLALACGGEPDSEPSESPPTSEATAEEPDGGAEPVFAEHTVERGETLSGIARRYEVSLTEVMEANELSRSDARRISVGQVLRIPGVSGLPEAEEDAGDGSPPPDPNVPPPPLEDGAYHTLAEGETLWDLANVYDKSVDEILEANQFSDDDVRSLRPGHPIAIPGIEESDIRHIDRGDGRRGIWHTIDGDESIWDIARQYRISASEVMSANDLDLQAVRALGDGRRLFIPGRAPSRPGGEASSERPLTGAQRRALGRARLLGLGSVRAGRKLLGGDTEPRWVRAAGGNPNRLPGTLRWPVTNGRFVRGYGSGEGGYHLAVDIAGDIGWNVRSAASGIVGYSGDGIRGYGNIVLVVHQGGWITMYAHNSVNFVVAGQRVRAGSVLAEVGSTGISRGPHVHFEFMFDGKNCDPAALFRPGLRYSRTRSRVGSAEWRVPGRRPDAVDCDPRRRHPNSRWVIHEDPGRDGE